MWPNMVANFGTNANANANDHLVAKFATNSSGAMWWRILQLMQVVPYGGQRADPQSQS